MSALAISGPRTIFVRRLAVATKTPDRIVGQLLTPILWVLVVAPALDHALGGFDSRIDYYSFLAVGQVAFLVPFTAMFSGLNVLVDNETVLPELLAAPMSRRAIPLANAAAVLVIALVQVALIVGLALARGATLHTSPLGVVWFVAATSLLTVAMYGVAEIVAWAVRRQEAYGPLIPAIGVTPWFLAGTLFPLTQLPAVLEQLSLALPWTHAVAVMRYGLLGRDASGLDDIWRLGNGPGPAALSVGVLLAFAVLLLALAVRVFRRNTTS